MSHGQDANRTPLFCKGPEEFERLFEVSVVGRYFESLLIKRECLGVLFCLFVVVAELAINVHVVCRLSQSALQGSDRLGKIVGARMGQAKQVKSNASRGVV